MSVNNIFRGGRPYKLDADRISEAYPVSRLIEGLVIEHSELDKILDEKRDARRYRNVVISWMKQQYNQNGLNIFYEPKIGLKVLDPGQMQHYAENKYRQKSGQLGKAAKLAGRVDRSRLDSVGQARSDHFCRVVAAQEMLRRAALKEIAIPLNPIQSLPRRKLPVAADPVTVPS